MTLPWNSCRFDQNAAQTVSGASHSAAYNNFVARSTGLDATHLTAYATLLDGLTTDGFFDGSGNPILLDALYIWATQSTSTRANAKLNLVQNLYNLTESGTVSFAADVGYTGDGSTFYLDPSFVPSSASSPKFVQDSASFGLAIQSTGNGGTTYAMGSATGNGAYFSPNDSGTMSTAINGPLFQPLNANQQGLWGLTRTAASGAGSSAVYRNGSTTPFATDTQTSTGVPGFSMVMFVLNIPTPLLFYGGQMSAAWIGAGLSAANYKKLSDRINTYLTGFSVGLY